MTAKKTPSAIDTRSWGYAEDFVATPEAIQNARAAELSLGLSTLSPGAVTALRFLARAMRAQHVAAVGAGAGVAGLALFEGMVADSVLTVIDSEAQFTDVAKSTFEAAGLPRRRYRAIPGNPLDVLTNLQSGAYDLVFINGDKLEYVEYLAQALRLLRHDGMVIVHDVLWHNLVADGENEDDETVIIREALASVLETEEFTPVLLPVGDGLLAAIKA